MITRLNSLTGSLAPTTRIQSLPTWIDPIRCLQVAKQRIVITLRSDQVNINSHSGHCLKVAVLRAFLFQLNSNSVWSLSPKSNQDLSAPPLHCTLFTFPFASSHISKFILFYNFFFSNFYQVCRFPAGALFKRFSILTLSSSDEVYGRIKTLIS